MDDFEIKISKVFNAPAADLYSSWRDDTIRWRWLPQPKIAIQSTTTNKSIRASLPDESQLRITFSANSKTKTQVTIEHEKIPDAKTASKMKSHWTAALERLKKVVASSQESE